MLLLTFHLLACCSYKLVRKLNMFVCSEVEHLLNVGMCGEFSDLLRILSLIHNDNTFRWSRFEFISHVGTLNLCARNPRVGHNHKNSTKPHSTSSNCILQGLQEPHHRILPKTIRRYFFKTFLPV